VQTSTAPYSSLSEVMQGIHRRGGRILTVANT
jgi:hypothetical protein